MLPRHSRCIAALLFIDRGKISAQYTKLDYAIFLILNLEQVKNVQPLYSIPAKTLTNSYWKYASRTIPSDPLFSNKVIPTFFPVCFSEQAGVLRIICGPSKEVESTPLGSTCKENVC